MPTCKNDPSKKYKGTEPSPKGMGWCAHGEKEGKVRKGKDGNQWIVKKVKNGSKRWIKNKVIKKVTKKLTVNKLKKKSIKYAINHKNDPKYKWIKTKQTNNFNFNNYLSISAKFNKSNTIIGLKEKNKNYTLSYFILNVYDKKTKQYDIVELDKTVNNKHYFKCNLKGKKVQIIAALKASNNSGLLDVEVTKDINILK